MIIVITGVSGSGKTEIGYKIAKKFNGELINADSRQIYRFINTANNKKIFPDIKTHLIDIKDPNETYSIYEFRNDAKSEICNIQNRNKLPIIVGGSVLYIKSLIYNMSLGSEKDQTLRDKLDKKSVIELQNILNRKDKIFFKSLNNSDKNNKRRLIRYIENKKNIQETLKINKEYVVFEIEKDNTELQKSIITRTKNQIKNGLIIETENLLKMGFVKTDPALSMIGTKETIQYIEGKITMRELENQINLHTMQYIKKQKTFLKSINEKNIVHYNKAFSLMDKIINKSQF